ncbi:MAG: fumarate reductase subunit D [Nitrospirae bacterium]|nr:MAG: fumarate reductase subunit D [Nitrospirota bacterium]
MSQPGHARPSVEPFWWFLFAIGGTFAALFLPVHILVHGILAPLGVVREEATSYERMVAWLSNPLVRLYLLALISLPLFHAAHRIKFTCIDLGWRISPATLSVLCYGTAALATGATWVLLGWF